MCSSMVVLVKSVNSFVSANQDCEVVPVDSLNNQNGDPVMSANDHLLIHSRTQMSKSKNNRIIISQPTVDPFIRRVFSVGSRLPKSISPHDSVYLSGSTYHAQTTHLAPNSQTPYTLAAGAWNQGQAATLSSHAHQLN